MHKYMYNLTRGRIRFAPETGNNSGANPPAQNTNGANPPTDDQNKTNKEPNIDTFADLWEPPSDEGATNKNNQQQPPQDNKQQDDPATVFSNHVKSLNLTQGVDVNKIANDLNGGNTESLNSAFQSVAENTYRSALITMQKVMDTKISQAVDRAVNAATGKFDSTFAIRNMEAELPFTKSAAVAPIARAVLAQFMKKNGNNLEKGIDSVKSFFRETSKLAAKDTAPPPGRPGSRNFSQPLQNKTGGDDDEDAIDFASLLG